MVFAAGGFDAVIGNPPYIRIQTMKEWAPLEVEFYKRAFAAAGKGQLRHLRGLRGKGRCSLLNPRGRLGFILPHKFFNAQYGEPLRGLLAEGQDTWPRSSTSATTGFRRGDDLHLPAVPGQGRPRTSCRFTKVADLEAWRKARKRPRLQWGLEGAIPAENITAAEWNFTVGRGADLFEKLRRMPVKLGDVADIFVGLQNGCG